MTFEMRVGSGKHLATAAVEAVTKLSTSLTIVSFRSLT